MERDDLGLWFLFPFTFFLLPWRAHGFASPPYDGFAFVVDEQAHIQYVPLPRNLPAPCAAGIPYLCLL